LAIFCHPYVLFAEIIHVLVLPMKINLYFCGL